MISRYRDLVETVLLALLIFMVVRSTVQNFRIEGQSMAPNLSNGQYLMVNKFIYTRVNLSPVAKLLPFVDGDSAHYLFRSPQRGDVVVFHPPSAPERDFIKRIIGEPGDTVELRMGKVYINGVPLAEPYILNQSRDTVTPIRLGPDEYYVLGDNRLSSTDSRSLGPVPAANIIGLAWFTYWPPSELGLAPNYTVAAQEQ